MKNRFLQTLKGTPLTGRRALLFGIAVVAVPSLIRAVVFPVVSLAVFLTYVPFVILACITLTPRGAVIVTLMSAAVADFFFMAPRFALSPTADDVFSVGLFLTISALVIAIVQSARRFLHHSLAPPSSEVPAKVIFSESGEEAWAHWDSDRPSVKLGPHKHVAEMMEDYIAQVELGERLTAKRPRR